MFSILPSLAQVRRGETKRPISSLTVVGSKPAQVTAGHVRSLDRRSQTLQGSVLHHTHDTADYILRCTSTGKCAGRQALAWPLSTPTTRRTALQGLLSAGVCICPRSGSLLKRYFLTTGMHAQLPLRCPGFEQRRGRRSLHCRTAFRCMEPFLHNHPSLPPLSSASERAI